MTIKNVDTSLEKMNSTMRQSLGFLDNTNVYIAIVFILFLYNLCVFKNINAMVSNLYDYTIVKAVMLLLVIYVSQKNCTLGLLLGMSYIISLYYNSMTENFENGEMKEEVKLKMENDENDDEEEQMSENNVEGFLTKPGMDLDLSRNNMNDSESMGDNMNNALSKKKCMQNYYPQNENVGDVCSPVATYQDEFNAQGLNSPIGYDDNQGGYTI
jgi:hypothetical protein